MLQYSRKQATKLLSYDKQQTKDLINKNEQTIFERNRQPDIKSDKNLMNNGGGGLLSDPLQRAAHLEKLQMMKMNPTINEYDKNSGFARKTQSQSENTRASNISIAGKRLQLYVHFDLKGAAPKITYFKELFPLLKKWGAVGVCMEYEDVFPFDGIVKDIRHKQAYTVNDIQQINTWAKENDLDVMPLLQTYGHLEFLLKIDKFSHLRENEKYPQVITPCINQTYTVLYTMIDQYLDLHPNMKYFHIGCDEVYYFLANPECTKFKTEMNINSQYELFAYHLSNIASYIKNKRPNLLLFIWHDV
ncbi:unnamed protein product, partial [Didymodactylos carnosus]